MNLFAKRLRLTLVVIVLFQYFTISDAFAQVKNADFIIGDALPDAPELSPRGSFTVGVQTLEVINKNQIDVLKSVGGIDGLLALPGIAQTPAAKTRAVISIDDDLLFSFGPRTGSLIVKLAQSFDTLMTATN